MLSAIYPVPASEVRLPFYLSGIGRTSPEFHVKRDKGLTSHQFLYTAKGCGVLEVGNRKYKLEKNSFMYLPPELPQSIILKMMNGIPAGWCSEATFLKAL